MRESRMRCQRVAQYLSTFADGELAEPLRSRVALHVAECATCTARLADYRRMDAVLAALPATRPSPHVYENIQLAIQAQADPQAVKEPLSRSRRAEVLRRRLAAVHAPTHAPAPLPELPVGRRARVTAGVLPALAAMLLITLALIGFERARQASAPSTTFVATPPSGAIMLQRTRAQVSQVQGQLSFTPVLPSYLPSGVRSVAVTTGSEQPSGVGSGTYLDVTWMYADGFAACQVHLREAPAALGWPGYSPASAEESLSWQLPPSPAWRPLNAQAGSQQAAVGQARNGFNVALAVQPCGGTDATQTDIAFLRLISLSMDAPYVPMVLNSIPNNGARLVLHWIAQGPGAGGYSEEVYSAGSNQEILIRQGGALVWKAIIRGQQALQLDPAQGAYFLGSATAAGGLVAAPPFLTLQFFYTPYSLAEQVDLWYLQEPATYAGKPVLQFALVNGPTPATAYVDPTSHEVIAVKVALGSPYQPGGPNAEPWFAAPCGTYTLIEYLAQAPPGTFDMTPPTTYSRTSTSLARPACPAGG